MISGIQKLTLLDYPGLVACTVFTHGCNLRCPFCHNPQLALGDGGGRIPEAELLAFLERRRGLLDGVAITGGEPLLHAGLPALLRRIKALGYQIKLDTNGSFPERLAALMEAGLLDYIAMDIKTAPENYAAAVGVPSFDTAPVIKSAALLMNGPLPYEFRTTAVKGLHKAADFIAIGAWLHGAQAYYIQRFEDSGELICGTGLAPFSDDEMARLLHLLLPSIPSAKLRGIGV